MSADLHANYGRFGTDRRCILMTHRSTLHPHKDCKANMAVGAVLMVGHVFRIPDSGASQVPHTCAPVRQGRITEVGFGARKHIYVGEDQDLIG